MRKLWAWVMAVAVVLGWGGAPAVAASSCAVPTAIPAPHAEDASEREPARLLPIAGYTLSVIWMPENCRNGARADQCTVRKGVQRVRERTIAASPDFMLHGLWPDGPGKDWPQYCKTAEILPITTIKAGYCATPSAQLIQHEWAKHGTCMTGYTPDRYFALSNRLFAGLNMPKLRALSYRAVTAREVQAAIAAANPGMTGDMMRLNVDRKGWLQEVWFCLDTGFRPHACAATQGGAAPDARVMIWRGGLNDRAYQRRNRYGGSRSRY